MPGNLERRDEYPLCLAQTYVTTITHVVRNLSHRPKPLAAVRELYSGAVSRLNEHPGNEMREPGREARVRHLFPLSQTGLSPTGKIDFLEVLAFFDTLLGRMEQQRSDGREAVRALENNRR